MRDLDSITGAIVDTAVRIHTRLGPGLLESVYETLLTRDLERRGYYVERQKPISFEFDGLHFADGFRADIIVENAVVIEIKSVSALAAVHSKQLLTYLRLLDYRVGLLLNFNSATMKDGIKRLVNQY